MEKLTHFDASGNAVMVDVGEKQATKRTATATGTIFVRPEVIRAIEEGTAQKGDVLGVARVAGIMAVKQTANLIPMCHTLLIQKAQVDFCLLYTSPSPMKNWKQWKFWTATGRKR